MNATDFIVVGAGSAGCMITRELATRYGRGVTLIEPPAATARRIDRQRPARWLNLLGSSEDHDLEVQPSEGLAGRVLRWPRGRGLGGSSRINAMIWLPPTDSDLRMLAHAGGADWNRTALEAALRRAESLVRPEPPRWLSEASHRALAAARQLSDAEPMVYQRTNRGGRRWHAGQLLRAIDAEKVRLVRGLVDRVVWDDDAAAGVEAWIGDRRETIAARRGVILAAGTLVTPAILVRSGVGPADALRGLGIPIRVDAGGVGLNLSDHLIMPVVFRVPGRHAFDGHRCDVRQLARWQAVGGGPVASNLAECGGWLGGGSIQMHVTPTHYLKHPSPTSPPAMTIGVNVTAPDSRGSLTVTSTDARRPVRIDAGYLSDEGDLRETVRGVRLARHLAGQPPLEGWLAGERVPGAKRETDESIAQSVRRYAQTLYHPVGTCAMGGVGSGSVSAGHDEVPVDERSAPPEPNSSAGQRRAKSPLARLRGGEGKGEGVTGEALSFPVGGDLTVQGASRLWVADASLFPRPTAGNPTATLMAVAVHAAKLIATQNEGASGRDSL